MDAAKALALFGEFETETYGWTDELKQEGHTASAYRVRLDAEVDEVGGRYFRLFVRIESDHPDPRDALLFIVEQAGEQGVDVELENSGVTIT